MLETTAFKEVLTFLHFPQLGRDYFKLGNTIIKYRFS